jgi:hypothetical protein
MTPREMIKYVALWLLARLERPIKKNRGAAGALVLAAPSGLNLAEQEGFEFSEYFTWVY